MYPVSAASRATHVLNSVSSLLKRCVGFMMAKMVLRELMDPLIFIKFKSFLNMLVPFFFFFSCKAFRLINPEPGAFFVDLNSSFDKLKFLFINFYQFLEDQTLAVTLFAQHEKKSYSIIMQYSSCVGTDPN